MNGMDYSGSIAPTTPGGLAMTAVERLPGDELREPCRCLAVLRVMGKSVRTCPEIACARPVNTANR
ncbi:MAG: hypothetical protein SNJ69_04630 [Chloroflexaceae bacterium]